MSQSSPSTPNGRLPYKLPLVMKEEGGDRWIEDADGVPIPPDQLIEAINLCAQSESESIPRKQPKVVLGLGPKRDEEPTDKNLPAVSVAEWQHLVEVARREGFEAGRLSSVSAERATNAAPQGRSSPEADARQRPSIDPAEAAPGHGHELAVKCGYACQAPDDCDFPTCQCTASAIRTNEYICQCGVRVVPHRCEEGTDF